MAVASALNTTHQNLCRSQNHQYALKLQDPFPQGWEPFFINCNDSSVEGIKSTTESGKKVWGVQFHPESAGGPLDTIEVSRWLTSFDFIPAYIQRRCLPTLFRSARLTKHNLDIPPPPRPKLPWISRTRWRLV